MKIPAALKRLEEAPREAVTMAYLSLAVSLLALAICLFKSGGGHGK